MALLDEYGKHYFTKEGLANLSAELKEANEQPQPTGNGRTVVVVNAVDWGIYTEQISAEHRFNIVYAELCGFLVGEDDEKLIIAPQWFKDGDTRCTLVIPKCTISSRRDINL